MGWGGLYHPGSSTSKCDRGHHVSPSSWHIPPMESVLPSSWRASADQGSWAAAARRADGTRVGGHMFIQVHQRAPAGESERGGGGNERQAPGGGGGPADLHHYHDSRPLSGRLMFVALFPLLCVCVGREMQPVDPGPACMLSAWRSS